MRHATNEVAVATGFSASAMVIYGIALVALILSLFFGRNES